MAASEEVQPPRQDSSDEGRSETKNCEEIALAETQKLRLLAKLG
jgi:hypothetical protein